MLETIDVMTLIDNRDDAIAAALSRDKSAGPLSSLRRLWALGAIAELQRTKKQLRADGAEALAEARAAAARPSVGFGAASDAEQAAARARAQKLMHLHEEAEQLVLLIATRGAGHASDLSTRLRQADGTLLAAASRGGVAAVER